MTRRTRLQFLATRYPHWGAHSGIGQFTRHLGSRFSVDFQLVSDDDSGLPLPYPSWRDRLRVRIQRSGMVWYKLSDLAAEMRTLVRCLLGQAHLVHFLDGEHGVQFLPRWLDFVPGRRPPVIASYHQPAEMLPDLIDPAVIRRLDAVVLVSPAQVAAFASLLPPDRIVTILHGIDCDFFSPGPPPGDGIFRCVTAGHWLRDWTAMRHAAMALKDRRDIEFHVVTSRETGLEGLPNVHFHKGLSDEDLVALYRRADLALLPLENSTANNTLLETIACGLPLLSTDIASVRAYVGAAEAVLLPPDSTRFGAAIEELARDPARRIRMGHAARARAETLAWPQIASQYAALYDRLLAGSAARDMQGDASDVLAQPSTGLDTPARDFQISVVIPARNAAETIAATLDSLLAQDWPHWHAIVVDDGSTDDTAAIARDFAARDPRIEAMSGPKAGAGAARNAGLARATAPWILFLDSDDTLLPTMMGRMTATLAAQPQADAVHCGWTFTDPDGAVIGTQRCPETSSDLFPVFACYCAFAIHACIFRRSLLEGAGTFDPGLTTCEDFDLWQRLARTGAGFVPLDEDLAIYRLRPNASWFNPEVFLADALTVVRRGHGPDNRLPEARVPERHRNGAPDEGLGGAEAAMVIWAAAMVLAHGGDARPLIGRLSAAALPTLDPRVIANALFRGVPLSLCRPPSGWHDIWPQIEGNIRTFCDALESAGAPGIAVRTLRALEGLVTRALAPASGDVGMLRRFDGTMLAKIEITERIDDLAITETDRVVVSIFNHGHWFGVIELPVFDGLVPAAVLADAIAGTFAWALLNSLFSEQIYPGLLVHEMAGGWAVERAGNRLIGGLATDPRADGSLHDQIGWTILIQELTGLPDWGLDRLYDPTETQPGDAIFTFHAGVVTRVELGGAIPSLEGPDTDAALVQATLGGAPVFTTRLEASGGRIPAAAVRAALLDRGKMELARIAVREGIILFDGDLSLSLRDRLQSLTGTHTTPAQITVLGGAMTQDAAEAALAGLGQMAGTLTTSDRGIAVLGSVSRSGVAGNDRRAALPSRALDLIRDGLCRNQPFVAVNTPPVGQILYLPELSILEDVAEAPAPRATDTQTPAGVPDDRHAFEKLFSKGADPWKYTSPYEQTKYNQTLALLPRLHDADVIEIGCAEGHFTRQLAPHVARLIATDISELALARAAHHCAGLENIDYHRLDVVTDDLPGPVDLVVCSEVLYYTGGTEALDSVAAKLAAALKPGGYLLTAHAFVVADDASATGFNWNLPFGAKRIGEAFSGIAGLALEQEVRTALYAIRLYRKAGAKGFPDLRRVFLKRPNLVLAEHVMPEPEAARHILWGGGVGGQVRGPLLSTHLAILMYHSISDTGPAALSRWRVDPAMFESHLRYLKASGFQPVTLADWRTARETNTPLAGRRVHLTFDDGYTDFEANALPLLQEYGFPATLFIPSGKVGQAADWDSWAGAPLPLADWDGLRRLRDAGIVIGAHGVTHRDLAGLDPASVFEELWGARTALERELDITVDAVAYPFGAYDGIVEHLAAASGFRHGVTTVNGVSDFGDRDMALRRVEVFGGRTLEDFIASLPD